jgi:hypothetical protein
MSGPDPTYSQFNRMSHTTLVGWVMKYHRSKRNGWRSYFEAANECKELREDRVSILAELKQTRQALTLTLAKLLANSDLDEGDMPLNVDARSVKTLAEKLKAEAVVDSTPGAADAAPGTVVMAQSELWRLLEVASTSGLSCAVCTTLMVNVPGEAEVTDATVTQIPRAWPCGHVACQTCVRRMLRQAEIEKKDPTCHMCRRPVPKPLIIKPVVHA